MIKLSTKSRRSVLTLILFLVGILFTEANGETVTVGTLKYELRGSEAVVAGATTSTITSADVPDFITVNEVNYNVTAVLDSSFYNKTKLTSVTLGRNVRELESRSFYGCTALVSFVMDSALTTIGDKAFYNCSKLNAVTISPALTDIGISAFFGCKALPSTLSLGKALRKVASNAFRNATSITAFDVDAANPWLKTVAGVLYTINQDTLLCYPGGRTVTGFIIGKTVKCIMPEAFRDQLYIKSVGFSSGLESIGDIAFGSCKLTSVSLPATVTHLGDAPFYDCTSLTSIKVAEENSLFKVSDNMLFSLADQRLVQSFGELPAEVTLPDNIRILSEYSFYGSTTLQKINLPATLKEIRDLCFCNCISLTELTVPDAVDTLGEMAFRGCKALKKAILGASVKYLPRSLFYDCNALESIKLPENLVSIGRMCFQYCHKLDNVTFPSSLRRIELQGFDECFSLKSAILNDGLEELGENAFLKCDSMVRARIPASITKWGSSAFYHLDMLSDIEFCEGLTSLGYQSFSWCKSLQHVTLPASLRRLEQSAFLGTGLKQIALPENLEFIGTQAFAQSSLESITIPDKIEALGTQAFYKCKNLKSFKAGSGLKELGTRTFRECDSLTNVELNEGLIDIGQDAFISCLQLTQITLPSTITALHKKCFYGCPLTKINAKMVKPVALAAANNNFGTDAGPIYSSCALYVPEESLNAYKSAAVWKEFSNILTSRVSTIDAGQVPEITGIYDMTGRRLEAPAAGQICIIRYSNGSVSKVMTR